MSITINNKNKQKAAVAINRWGDDGSTSFFDISTGKTEEWDRTNSKGFVMSVKFGTGDHEKIKPYYVLADSYIILNEDYTVTYQSNGAGLKTGTVIPEVGPLPI